MKKRITRPVCVSNHPGTLMELELQKLMTECHDTAVLKGFWNGNPVTDNFAEKIALMHSELSEALEHYREYGLDPKMFLFRGGVIGDKPDGIAAEFADVIIRILDVCGHWKIPVHKAITAKMKYNQTRPYRHGGKKA